MIPVFTPWNTTLHFVSHTTVVTTCYFSEELCGTLCASSDTICQAGCQVGIDTEGLDSGVTVSEPKCGATTKAHPCVSIKNFSFLYMYWQHVQQQRLCSYYGMYAPVSHSFFCRPQNNAFNFLVDGTFRSPDDASCTDSCFSYVDSSSCDLSLSICAEVFAARSYTQSNCRDLTGQEFTLYLMIEVC